MVKNYLLLFCLLFSFVSKAQILNAYAKVTDIKLGRKKLTVSNVNESNHTFNIGDQVLIMQMQDSVIGTNTTNIATFGDLSIIAKAGIYEIGTIDTLKIVSGIIKNITLSSKLVNTFNTGDNSSVQIISFRDLGTNYTTTANITGLPWDGNIGGVIAINIANTLTLNHSISADGIGFRKGNRSKNIEEGCNNTTYIADNTTNHAFKGEGIYKSINSDFTNGRGKILNGGGGGNTNNGGGGGGGNYSSGGTGGFGWTCTSTNQSGGIGGISLSSYIAINRVFMGGGGGGGQQNNNVSSDGGNGGGIILVKAKTLKTTTTCGSAISISANGENSANSGNDGAGGGGAAGSIILQIDNYTLDPICPLTIAANGGNGGTVGDGGEHGGGGGGGQGIVMFPAAQPNGNVTTTTSNGNGGGNSNAPGAPTADSGSGTGGTGILTNSVSPLPVELISFNGVSEDTHNSLFWQSAIELNFKNYEIESAIDGMNFTKISTIAPLKSYANFNHYNYLDFNHYKPITYYRLKMVDLDNTYKYSNVVAVEYGKELKNNVLIYPNPAFSELYISITSSKQSNVALSIYDIYGRVVYQKDINLTSKFEKTSINTSDFAAGTYIVNLVYQNGSSENIKVIINPTN